MNQHWLIIKWILKNTLHLNLKQNANTFFQENATNNVDMQNVGHFAENVEY